LNDLLGNFVRVSQRKIKKYKIEARFTGVERAIVAMVVVDSAI
jgi:hypothetical protein